MNLFLLIYHNGGLTHHYFHSLRCAVAHLILTDVDATLLDFLAAEKAAIKKLFQEFDLGECTDEMIRRYSKINRLYWEQLECGELTKPEVLVGRFREFFETDLQ